LAYGERPRRMVTHSPRAFPLGESTSRGHLPGYRKAQPLGQRLPLTANVRKRFATLDVPVLGSVRRNRSAGNCESKEIGFNRGQADKGFLGDSL
jgi:hypothetical protein